jgi:hypothetical protein
MIYSGSGSCKKFRLRIRIHNTGIYSTRLDIFNKASSTVAYLNLFSLLVYPLRKGHEPGPAFYCVVPRFVSFMHQSNPTHPLILSRSPLKTPNLFTSILFIFISPTFSSPWLTPCFLIQSFLHASVEFLAT